MTRQQAVVLVAVNAVVSALISLLVVGAGLTLYPPTVVQQVVMEGTVIMLVTAAVLENWDAYDFYWRCRRLTFSRFV